jgi:organic radical activating enzyme
VNELPLMEAYLTVQGEGFHQGTPAWFIRLGGCDVGCVWCDTMDSWDASHFDKVSVTDIAASAKDSGAQVVVVTGGEPLMYDLTKLTTALHDQGLQTHAETSGAHPLTGTWDWVTFSPKKFKPPQKEFYQAAQELKVVIFHPQDLEWAEGHAKKMLEGCKLSLQPEWSKKEEISPLILNYIQQNPHWNISMQLHKFLGVR